MFPSKELTAILHYLLSITEIMTVRSEKIFCHMVLAESMRNTNCRRRNKTVSLTQAETTLNKYYNIFKITLFKKMIEAKQKSN